MRVLVSWNRVPGVEPDTTEAPSTIHYDWSRYDSLIDDAARHGLAKKEIDRMVSGCSGAGVPVIAAFDGMVLDLA